MSKDSKFTITLTIDQINNFIKNRKFYKEDMQNVLCFNMENIPNLSENDIITVNVIMDKELGSRFKAKVIGIVPPLNLKESEGITKEGFESHVRELSKFMVPSAIKVLKTCYEESTLSKYEWCVYFKNVKDL
jgi:hypothetical protein